MFDSFKKFFETLFSLDKRDHKDNNEVNNLNQIITNNNTENNMELNIVIPGHYCSNDTLNAEVKKIIRVIGPNINREGWWKTDDGKSLPESVILDSYTLLDTKPTNNKDVRKIDIMKGLKPIKIKEEQEPEHVKQPIVNQQPETLIVETPVKNDVEILLEKASIKSLNDNYQKKYGTKPYKSLEIEIPVKISIDYELNKLSQICEIFDIDIHQVTDLILKNVQIPRNILREKIESYLLDNIIKSKQPVFDTPNENEQPNENEELETGINDIQEYINSMFNNK